MNKRTIIINGIRAAKFKITFNDGYNFLNDLILVSFYSNTEKPTSSIKITIKPRHTKFKYSKYAIQTALSIYNGRIYKIYFLKNRSWFAWSESEVTKYLNSGGQF